MESLKQALSAPTGAPVALPFSAYRDVDVYELEMEHAFRGDWVAVCSVSELTEPGSYRSVVIGDELVAVVRGADGELRALSNNCRHRGTMLLDDGFGRLEGTSIVCPYHAWSYDHQGSLRGVPLPGSVEIDRSEHCLPNYPIEIWLGVIFVNVSGTARPLSERLAGVNELLQGYDLDRYTMQTPGFGSGEYLVEANWKLVMANAIEPYHLFKVHETTLETIHPTKTTIYLEGSAEWTVIGGDYVTHDEKHSWEPEAMTEFERGRYLLVSLPPSFVAVITRDQWFYAIAHPDGVDKTRFIGNGFTPPELYDEQLANVEEASAFVAAFGAEDLHIMERGQASLRSRVATGGNLVEMERILGDMHQYLGARLFGFEPDPVYSEAKEHFRRHSNAAQ